MLSTQPFVLAVSISPGGIPKVPQPSAQVRWPGLSGDGRNHAKHVRLDRAVSLWDMEILERLRADGYCLSPGAAGENLTVVGLDVQHLPSGTLLQLGEVVLRLEQPRKPCYVLDAIDPRLKDDMVGRCGYLASVVREGEIRPHMPVKVVSNKEVPLHLDADEEGSRTPERTYGGNGWNGQVGDLPDFVGSAFRNSSVERP